MGTIKLNKHREKSEEQASKKENFSIDTLVEREGQIVPKQIIAGAVNCNFIEKDGGFVEEFKELRTANETVYKRNDGTCRKIVTASPTRYRDKSGEYKQISNKLIDNGQEIVNEANLFKVKFDKNAHSDKIFDLQRDGKKLTLSAVGSGKARGHVCGCKCELCAGTDNSVTATLDDGTEIEYLTLSDRIKENIIVKERQDSYEYDFKLDVGDLIVEEGEHNDLLLKDKQTGETEFKIPAPYMYDANNKRSNKVSYEIEVNGSELEIKVIADAEFINAEDRVFPVTIDPQIIDQKTTYEGISFVSRTQWFDENETITYDTNYLEVRDDGDVLTDATVTYKAPSSIPEGHIVGVTLILSIDSGLGNVNVNGEIYNAGANDTEIEIPVGIGGAGSFKIYCARSDFWNNYCEFRDPWFVIDYIEVPEAYRGQEFNANNPPMIKDFDFTDKATGHVYAKYGTLATSFKSFDAEDFVLPLNISHCHKVGIGKTEFGMDWRLNLNRKLKSRGSSVFLYIDELGDKYILSEKYYYADGDNVYTVNKQSVTIDVNGNMTYRDKPVYKYQTFNGLTLISEIKDFINYDLVQQKSDEIIQLEDYLNQLAPTLKSCVNVDIKNGNFKNSFSGELTEKSKTHFDGLVNTVASNPDIYVIMTKNEALQLQSLFTNQTQLELQNKQLNLQTRQILQQAKELTNSKILSEKISSSCSDPMNLSSFEPSGNNKDEQIAEMREKISWHNADDNLKLLTKSANNEDDQYELVIAQIEPTNKQLTQVKEQIKLLINQAKANFEVLKETFVKYFSKLQELTLLRKQTPVNYLRDENEIISGFNSNGDLVLICDKYGNGVNIVYDTKNRISEIYDTQGKTMNFEYQGSLLYRITDNLGRRVQYSYKGIELIKVVYADGSFIDFEYQGKYNIVRSVMSSTDFQAKVSVDDFNRVTNIATNSKPVTISAEVSKEKESFNKTIANIAVDYDKNESGEVRTTFTSKDNKTERYTFNSISRVKLIEKTDNNFVKTVTALTYDSNGNVTKSVMEHDIDGTEEESSTFNAINQLKSKTSGWKNISDTVKVKTATSYTYDGSGNLIKEITIKQTDVSGTITPTTEIKIYSYNPQGSVTLTESYIEGEEATAGKNYEKRIYDENGKVTKTISWNSLDSTSKFYTENDRAENGQVTADRAETGEISAEYEYVEGTNVVNSVKYPNGSKFAYGRNPNNFEITGITQSTDDGEENVTDITYNYGLPVEVKSGNTTLGYTYDHTRRKTAISVNGVTQATYTYKDYTYNTNQNKCTFGEQTSSSKFYEESERLENGQVLVTKNEVGDSSEEYEYIHGTNIVNTIEYSNGSKLSYGRDPKNFKVTSITQSTDDGEANNTNINYQYGMPVKVESGNTVLEYEYDQKGRKTSVKVNGVEQITSTYKDYESETIDSATYLIQTDKIKVDNKEIKIVYSKTGSYDEEARIMDVYESITIGGSMLSEKKYDINGNISYIKYVEDLSDVKDINAARRFDNYIYDSYFNLIKIESVLDGGNSAIEEFTYNEFGKLVQKSYTGDVTQTYSYTYMDNAARNLDYITFGGYKIKPLTDVNGRNTGKEIYNGANKLAAEYITYRKVGDHATNMPATVWFGNGSQIKDNIKYKYDSCGNICQITENGHIVVMYTYDSLNRLVREDNKLIGKTTVFTYDQNGNIIERCVFDYTSKSGDELFELDCRHYSCDYDGDKLINYNGETFEYNSLGNPTTYRGKNCGWQYGTRLTKLGDTTFAYDGLGRRTSKNDIKFTYDSDGRLLKQSNGLEFFYDNAGVAGVKYDGSIYLYRKDVQGNIIAILDSNGEVVVRYYYDAWGNNAVIDNDGSDVEDGIGALNPFRYRGYYYDTETGLYYLQTRYYDPDLGRFISQDSLEYADPETINGLNLYVYCKNNPVMNVDPNGTLSLKKFWGWLVTGVVAAFAVAALVVGSVFTGGLLSAVLVGAGAGALFAMGGSIIKQGGFINADPWQVAKAGGIGALIGAISGAASYGMGVIGSSFGEFLGTSFGNATHLASGIKFGQVFNSGILSAIGKVAGNVVGGYIGGSGANYFANKFFGEDLDLDEFIKQGFMGEFPMWLVSIFKWL